MVTNNYLSCTLKGEKGNLMSFYNTIPKEQGMDIPVMLKKQETDNPIHNFLSFKKNSEEQEYRLIIQTQNDTDINKIKKLAETYNNLEFTKKLEELKTLSIEWSIYRKCVYNPQSNQKEIDKETKEYKVSFKNIKNEINSIYKEAKNTYKDSKNIILDKRTIKNYDTKQIAAENFPTMLFDGIANIASGDLQENFTQNSKNKVSGSAEPVIDIYKKMKEYQENNKKRLDKEGIDMNIDVNPY